ncbi:glycosyltransferase family 2 protein [Sphingopyxis sp.]|uniref:glycosyltransferase family 2 protein n=1 Tax=Sphingopyxis sp. TaxID=1908224 RepID=UPI002D7950DD|nr:glycosyltransferase family 2 protein [Sphingopyxis sp.]HET6526066.1 glycosyltransferase family 2 protein [Sphingopyxis sp.]
MFEPFAWLIALSLAAPLSYLGVELFLGLRPLSPKPPRAGPAGICVLVPAHNEAAGIAATVEELVVAAPGAQILVVADNCSDATAARARQAGADVVERNDPGRRGKGFALACGRERLTGSPPDVVIVIDADCRLEKGSADRLAARAMACGGAVQAANLLTAELDASPLVAVSNFAMLVKNLIRARGLVRLGGGALLFGTGMAFPWSMFATLPLASGDAVEDLNLGLWLAHRGSGVELDDRSLVTSPAAPLADSHAQRSRWEHGFLRTAVTQAMPMLFRGVATASRHALSLGAHLLVPPLALLILLTVPALAMLAAAGACSGSWAPLLLTGASFGFAVSALLASWWKYGRGILPLAALLRIPVYILWKIPIYVGFFTHNQKVWNRTRREDERH